MKILVLGGPLFEDLELTYPYYRLQEEGYEVLIGAKEIKEYEGKHGVPVKADVKYSEIDMKDFDALVIPGGIMPDKIRIDKDVQRIVKDAIEDKKKIAVICHGGQIMISSAKLSGITMTSVENIKDDLINAGVNWVDEEVHVDNNIVSSRKPYDLPAFMREFVKLLKQS